MPGTYPGGHTPEPHYPQFPGHFPGGHQSDGPHTGGGITGSGGGMSQDQQSAFSQLVSLLDEYGLSELDDFVRGLILNGTTDSATLMLKLQETDAWKRRFAGNEMLKQRGLGALSPAEYLATERSYAQIMKNYGLPQGFYDDPADFAKFIGNNVSAAELQQRVSAYSDLATREDPAIVNQLKSMGLSQGDLLAFTMDPERAAPLVMRQYQTALLGGAARRSGVTADNNYLSQLAGRGVSEQQASQGYGLIGQSLADARTLGQVYGEDYGISDLQGEVFDNNAASAKKRKRLASQERAAFGGSAGATSLGRNTSGSY